MNNFHFRCSKEEAVDRTSMAEEAGSKAAYNCSEGTFLDQGTCRSPCASEDPSFAAGTCLKGRTRGVVCGFCHGLHPTGTASEYDSSLCFSLCCSRPEARTLKLFCHQEGPYVC